MANAYLKAALLTIALTLLAFFFIAQLDAMRAAELRKGVEDLVLESESERLVYQYAEIFGEQGSGLCGYVSSASKARTDKAYELAEKIRYYELSNVVNDEYEQIKTQYFLSNAGLYLNVQATKKYCGSYPYKAVLFFYRAVEDCSECRAQGGVLDTIVKEREDVRVFAFHIDTSHEFINVLARRHNITSVPAIVVDESIVLYGLQDREALLPLLEGKG